MPRVPRTGGCGLVGEESRDGKEGTDELLVDPVSDEEADNTTGFGKDKGTNEGAWDGPGEAHVVKMGVENR